MIKDVVLSGERQFEKQSKFIPIVCVPAGGAYV